MWGEYKSFNFRRPLQENDNKYRRGVVGVIAGSDQYPGAALLTIGGARLGGAGYVKFHSSSRLVPQLALEKYPDVVPMTSIRNERLDALVVGPGGGKIKLLPPSIPIVLDSSALSRAKRVRSGITVITPHEGELSQLGYSLHDRYETAQKIAVELGVIVVLKGSKTLIISPEGEVHIDSIGGPELATAGTGDVLAGLMASMLASWRPSTMHEAHTAVVKAVTMHSLAGKDAAKRLSHVTALDVLDSLSYL